ncbi:unnamed protein product [Didymodactylos carnosus]|uniref:Tetraspanin n=1 Tax=Didymodactylos carnosus TaxID=1234261 RepID=A0A813T5H6_9BILA|nr:unnamed protein product [Didymodactylos carnosus]CAF3591158.1 unnamed protein product [Didymodactylos carnosus]
MFDSRRLFVIFVAFSLLNGLTLIILSSLILQRNFLYTTFSIIDQTHFQLVKCCRYAIAIGFVLLASSILALVGGIWKRKLVCLRWYFVLTTIVFVIQLSLGLTMALVYRGGDDKLMFCNEMKCSKEWEYLQTKYHCCGDNSKTDWIGIKPIPHSCYDQNKQLYSRGCKGLLSFDDLTRLSEVTVFFSVFQFMGLLMTIRYLYELQYRKENVYMYS